RLRVRRAQSRADSRRGASPRRGAEAGNHRGKDPGAEHSVIRLTGIRKSFGPVQANRGAALDVAKGEIHALVGENGAGKSTLMRIMSGMFQPDAGSIEVNGRDVTGWRT